MVKIKVGMLAFITLLALVFVSGAVLAAEDTQAATPAAPAKNVVDTLAAAGRFAKLSELLKIAGLVDTLKGAGPFTVLAPNDAAFAALPEETLDAIVKDEAKLKALLQGHVVAAKTSCADMVNAGSVKTLAGSTVVVKKDGEVVIVGEAKVVKADIDGGNGVIYEIDKVLQTPAPAK